MNDTSHKRDRRKKRGPRQDVIYLTKVDVDLIPSYGPQGMPTLRLTNRINGSQVLIPVSMAQRARLGKWEKLFATD